MPYNNLYTTQEAVNKIAQDGIPSGGGGGAVTMADGANVTQGAIADAVVAAGAAGTVSAKLRRLTTDLDSVKTNTTGLSTSANQTNGTQQTRITDGTNTANVLKSDGTAAGQNAQLSAGAFLSVPFTTTSVAAVGTTDAGNYAWVSLDVSSQGTSSTVTFQVSDDGTTWRNTFLSPLNSNTSWTSNITSAVTGIYSGPLNGRYFRLNVTGISAGTTSGQIVFSSYPRQQSSINAIQAGSWTVLATTARQTIQASAAQTTSGNSSSNTTGGNYKTAVVTLNCTAFSGTTPTLNVKIQVSDDGGTTWYDLPNATFTQLTGTGSQAIQINTFGDTIRAAWTIGGTTPSFTFAVKAVFTS